MKDYLWVEKYRPQKIEDCILTNDLKQTFLEIVRGGEFPNMLFSGTAGLGKTTVAKALCNSLNLDLSGDIKVVVLDEADYLNPQSTQPALRGFIEEFSDNCRFILTCNFKNRIIEPLHSRCGVYEFNTNKQQKVELCGEFLGRVIEILKLEGIDTNSNTKKSLADLIMKHAPDIGSQRISDIF
jgi:DNA polymerase III delta prime subunit